VGGGDDSGVTSEPATSGTDPRRRSLPAVHELAGTLDAPPGLAVSAARRTIDARRAELSAGATDDPDLLARAQATLERLRAPSLRRVLNATGVILHTNLGRAPLATAARDAVARAAYGYANLELDLEPGTRGSRQTHVEALLTELTGAEAALVVNNGAAAVLLAVASLAGSGGAVVVSRGQLVEIGGGFRIPEVVAQSGARLVEVGTTNRTRLEDYRQALTPDAAILRVHPSNFRVVGFTAEAEIEALCGLGAPVIDDVGSGVLADAAGMPQLADEPSLRRSVAAGAALVCCSGDKLLGGPQAGLIVGRRERVRAAANHPLARALRIDKLSLAALQATLALYRDPAVARREIPVLAMLDAGEPELSERAQRLRDAIGPGAVVTRDAATPGGGALPLLQLEGPVVAVEHQRLGPQALAAALRVADPPLIGRIHAGRLILDPRTLTDEDLGPAATAVRLALNSE
jgi:L-seryl-tRNA(Ser) seleniumtransferase